jgi:uncharacterized protein YbbK (DUF523 family)
MKARRREAGRIRVGVSSCLLGERVRYDGGHKRDACIVATLGKIFAFVPVCPEVAVGLGVPRPPIRLVGSPRAPRAVVVDDPKRDVTVRLAAYGRRRGRELDDISGYIFKSRSPSCGIAGVPIATRGRRRRSGSGIYAGAVMTTKPLLPVTDETGLADAARSANFIERVFALRRWQDLVASGLTPGKLSEFHAAHELTLLVHGARLRALSRLVARVRHRNLQAVAGKYILRFMEALRRPATRRRQARVLRRVARDRQRQLNAAEARRKGNGGTTDEHR